MNAKASVAVAVLACVAALPAQATVIISISRDAFQDAVADGTIASENFDSYAPGTILGVTPDVTYGASGGDPLVTDDYLTSTPPNGLGSTSAGFFLVDETATFTFSTPITAFAIDINTFADTDGAYSASLDIGVIVTSLFEVFPSQDTGQFIGFVSDTPFSQVTLAGVTGFSYTLDTLVYGDAAAVAVPLPAAWLLMAGALSLLGCARRSASRHEGCA